MPSRASACSSVPAALHATRLSHSEPPSAAPSPAPSVESLTSEGSSRPGPGELLVPPTVPKSSSEPAVHAPGLPAATSAGLSANSSSSSSAELLESRGERTPQASPALAHSGRSSPRPPPAKPTPISVEARSPAPSPGTSSPQLQIKVSVHPVGCWHLSSGAERKGQKWVHGEGACRR